MSDPLADKVSRTDDPYRTSPVRSLLARLYENSSPEQFLQATEQLLQRIVLLEMYLEQERNIEISAEELESYRAAHYPELQREAGLQASLMYGSVARREGG